MMDTLMEQSEYFQPDKKRKSLYGNDRRRSGTQYHACRDQWQKADVSARGERVVGKHRAIADARRTGKRSLATRPGRPVCPDRRR